MTVLRPTRTLLDGFPKHLDLADGATVVVRPLRQSDQPALLAFFRAIPEPDRWWLREDVSDPTVIRHWLASLDYDRVLPLVALVGESIVADATLHRRGFGARQRNAEVRMVVAPPYRGLGLAYALLAELCEIAAAAGLARVEAEIAGRAQSGAREAVEQFGFEHLATLPDHLVGPDGRPHDLHYLVYRLDDIDAGPAREIDDV